MALTFMAKYDEREGNSCHIHLSLRDADGVRGDGRRRAGRHVATSMRHFLAGQLAALRELTLLYAPNINSYKRFRPGSFAPTAVAWGPDNRTCALRVVGHGAVAAPGEPGAGRRRQPVPRRRRDDRRRPARHRRTSSTCPSRVHGQRLRRPDAPHVPTTLREAAELWEDSPIARAAFGDEVVEHYANMARVELDAFDAAVTDWERFRAFERM